MNRRDFLGHLAGFAGASTLMDLPKLLHAAQATGAQKRKLPNIVMFLVDDLGWGDLGCYGNTFHETPNIDKLAHDGMKFNRAYAGAPVCSPSRAAIITGQFPARAIAPYPQVARTREPTYFINDPLWHTGYNAFIVELTKRTPNGLSMNLSYTLAKATGNTHDAYVDTYSAGNGYQDPYSYQKYAKYPEAGYAPQVVKGFLTYQLPFGRGQRYFTGGRLSNALLGGWLAGAILNYQSGAPIGAIHAQTNYPGWSGLWVDVAPNASFKNTFKKLDLINLHNPSNQFVNPTIFSNPPDGQLGNSPVTYGNWHGWGTGNEDVSLTKQFGIGQDGRYKVLLRGEFFNVFNRHHYGNPNLNIGGPYFGQVTNVVGNPRQGQVSARFSW